jgi:hypothetical protein
MTDLGGAFTLQTAQSGLLLVPAAVAHAAVLIRPISTPAGSVSQLETVSSPTGDDMIDASVSQEDLLAMLHEMDNTSNMTIIVGNTKPMMVSLVGSTTVTNAFLTCAGIKGDIKTPGSNPFE